MEIREESISFEITNQAPGFISIICSQPTRNELLKLSFPTQLELRYDNLAIALSTLAGSKFENIEFNFAISENTRSAISDWTKSITYSESRIGSASENPDQGHTGVLLNFSGGFDSLAARELLPQDTTLLSLDFGGRFSREKEFFTKFDTHTVSTNLVTTTLRKNSWSFMGLGAILLNSGLQRKYISFGSVLEATQLSRSRPRANTAFPPFRAAGFENASPVIGLSEAGTVAILLSKQPHLIQESLFSLASPGEEKLYRKWALAMSTASILSKPAPIEGDVIAPRTPHFNYGENLVVDLTAIYLIAFGFENMIPKMVKSMPSESIAKAKTLDLDFMLKADQSHYEHYPEDLRSKLDSTLIECGVEWYGKSDHHAIENVRDFLSENHPF